MGGGKLQIELVGPENLIFIGNPQVTFFKKVFKRYANFGIEKIKISPDKNSDINLNNETIFTYNVERFGDLALDMYFTIDIPNIWSPIYSNNSQLYANNLRLDSNYSTEGRTNKIWSVPYEFKWIKNLGAHIIKNVKVKIDDQIIQDYSGDYILSIVERDLSAEKKKLFDEMIGNTERFNDPGNYLNRKGNYPSACYFSESLIDKDSKIDNLNQVGLEPSIRGEQLYIPLNNWSMLDSSQAIPLISMQTSKVTVEVTLRPVREWFVIRNIRDMLEVLKKEVNLCNLNVPEPFTDFDDYIGAFTQKMWVAPDFTSLYDQFYLFLIEPPYSKDEIFNGTIDPTDEKLIKYYYPYATNWSANPMLVVNYIQLDNIERNFFAQNSQNYIINQVFEKEYYNLFGNNRINTNSIGLLKCWQWFFRRSDVNLRNEWNNYTNFDYENNSNDLNEPLSAFVSILKTKLKDAGSLTNLIENDPLTFSRIYYYAIIKPIYDDDSPLISLFNPPFLFGYGKEDLKISNKAAFEFHAKVNEVNRKNLRFLNNWSLAQRGAIFNCINTLTPTTLSGPRENTVINVEYFESIFYQEEIDDCGKTVNKLYGLIELNNLVPIPVLEISKSIIFYEFFGIIEYLLVIENNGDCESVINIYKKKTTKKYTVPYDNPEMREFLIPVYEKVYCHCLDEICKTSNINFFKTKSNENLMFVIDNAKILLSENYGESWALFDFFNYYDDIIQDIVPANDLKSIFILHLNNSILVVDRLEYGGIQEDEIEEDEIEEDEIWKPLGEIAKLSYTNYNIYGDVKLLVSYNNNLILISKKDIRFINLTIIENSNPQISNVMLENRNAINYYFNIESFNNEFKSSNLIIDNIAYNNESKIIYLLIKDFKNLKYYIMVSIDYGQSFKIYNIYNDNKKDIYKMYSIDINEEIYYFDTNFNGDVLLIKGKNIFEKFLNIMNVRFSLEDNDNYNLKFISKKANRNLVSLSKDPFFVYYEDNIEYDNTLLKEVENLLGESSQSNNNIQIILLELIENSEILYNNPTNEGFINLTKMLKNLLNKLLELSSNNNLENILYFLLEREPVIRNFNFIFEKIQKFKDLNANNFEVISNLLLELKKLNLKFLYKDLISGILAIRTNNLLLKDIIVDINLEILIKINTHRILTKVYNNFVSNVNIFNKNMQIVDRKIQVYSLLENYLSESEIDKHLQDNTKITDSISKNINFITLKSSDNIPVVLLFSYNSSFFREINKVYSLVTRNLNYKAKLFNGTAYQNIFKNVNSLPNKNMVNLPQISSRDFMYISPLFWQVGDIDFPKKISEQLYFNDNSYPPEWTELKNTEYKWYGYGSSKLENFCIENNFKKIYDFSGGDKIPNWELIEDSPDYWIEERDAPGVYEELLLKWNLIESTILLQDKSCLPSGIIDDLTITKPQPQKLENIMLTWGFSVDTEVRERKQNQIVQKYIDTYSNGENGITKDGLYFYNFALNSSILNSQPSGSFNSSFFTRIDWDFELLNPDYRIDQLPISVVCTDNNPNISSQEKNPNLTQTEVYKNFEYTYTLKIMEERYNILTTSNGVGRLVLSN